MSILSHCQKECYGAIRQFFKVNLLKEKSQKYNYDNKENHHHHHHNHKSESLFKEETHIHGGFTEHIHRNLFDIEKIIKESKISDNAKQISIGIFKIIAIAEAKVHGKEIGDVHFHEVGATDSIIDIVSTGILIDYLNIDRFVSSSIPTGFGFVKTSHGKLPIPAPATLEILKDIPAYQGDIAGELTTPTGAAIVKYLTKEFGYQPEMSVTKIGLGAGSMDLEIPNILRLSLGESDIKKNIKPNDTIIKLETNIDDASPEELGFLFEKIFEKNALDIFFTPVLMKKNRLATILTVLCHEKERDAILNFIFANSTTFGVRETVCNRTILDREIREFFIDSEKVRVKIGYLNGKVIKVVPEFEDIKNIAQKYSISFGASKDLIIERFKNI